MKAMMVAVVMMAGCAFDAEGLRITARRGDAEVGAVVDAEVAVDVARSADAGEPADAAALSPDAAPVADAGPADVQEADARAIGQACASSAECPPGDMCLFIAGADRCTRYCARTSDCAPWRCAANGVCQP